MFLKISLVTIFIVTNQCQIGLTLPFDNNVQDAINLGLSLAEKYGGSYTSYSNYGNYGNYGRPQTNYGPPQFDLSMYIPDFSQYSKPGNKYQGYQINYNYHYSTNTPGYNQVNRPNPNGVYNPNYNGNQNVNVPTVPRPNNGYQQPYPNNQNGLYQTQRPNQYNNGNGYENNYTQRPNNGQYQNQNPYDQNQNQGGSTNGNQPFYPDLINNGPNEIIKPTSPTQNNIYPENPAPTFNTIPQNPNQQNNINNQNNIPTAPPPTEIVKNTQPPITSPTTEEAYDIDIRFKDE